MDMKSSVSRGLMLKRLAAIPFVALGIGATLSAAQAADNKKQFKYQDKPGPKGQKCAGCRFFKKPNACVIVTGKISPNGWCISYAPGAMKK
jgi:high potential iron-sulfur protein